ncbi:MAG: rhamnulokinase family protein [Armatimonadota bacterium]
MARFLAVDLGAESGRGVTGTLGDDGRLRIDEVHRFPNGPIRIGDTLHWDFPRLVAETRAAIARADEGGPLQGIGVDTWGVDFGLIGPSGELVGLPVHYRDARTNGWIERLYAKVPQAEVFAATGIQTMSLNTLFQLAALQERSPGLLAAARTLLFVPDLLHWCLTGRAASEVTIASTSQVWDPVARDWARGLLERLGLPTGILPEVLPDGAEYGPLRADGVGLPATGTPVYAPAGHDTASAVAAVPAAPGDDWAYLSSGTWSLLGLEIPAPILTPAAAAANITNEGGAAGTIRFLKNIGGLWLVQECRRAWARLGDERSYEQLTRLAAEAKPMAAIIDPDHPSLLAPADMPAAIRQLCADTGQTPPEGIGATVRCCLDSLGLKYRSTLRTMEELTGRRVRTLHIVGGGSRNALLNQIAADATGCVVHAGPVEATAIGNVLLQARSAGLIRDLADLRRVVRDSFPIETFVPDPDSAARWDALAARGLR